MLSNIKTSKSHFSSQATPTVVVSHAQEKIINNIRANGGAIDVTAVDKRTINALLRKKVVDLIDDRYILRNILIETKKTEPMEESKSVDVSVFKESCQRIYGKGYQKRLAIELGCNPSAVAKWFQGIVPVPDYALKVVQLYTHMLDLNVPLPDHYDRTRGR